MKTNKPQAPNRPDRSNRPDCPGQYAAWLAIDWADRKHDVRLLDARTGKTETFEIEHSPEALADFVSALRRRFGSAPVALAVELRRGPLINFLSAFEFIDIYPVNTTTVSWFRKAFHPSGAKSDPLDSELILEILVKHPDRLEAPWKPEAPELRLLAELCETRRGFVDQATKTVLQLTACLKNYYPQALGIIGGNLAALLACDFLVRWPDLDKLGKAKAGALRRFFHLHNCRSEKRIAKAIQTACDPVPLTRDPAILEGQRIKALSLVKTMRTCLALVETYDSRIKKVFASCPDAFVFKSLPGAGEALAPRLLCATGARRERFPSAANLAQYVGCAPVTERSGRQILVHWRWASPTFHRQSFVEFAQWSINYSAWVRAYNELLKERGDRGPTRMRKIAFKWSRIIHRCWRRRVAYDEATYLDSLRKTNSPVWRKIQELQNTETAGA